MHLWLFVPSGSQAASPDAHGPKKRHQNAAATKHCTLGKLAGVFVPPASTDPHKQRECLLLITFLRDRLKCALTGDEGKEICMQCFIEINGKVQTNITYPAGHQP